MQAMDCEDSNRRPRNYYEVKGSQVNSQISQIEEGKRIDDVEIRRALDDSDSTRYYDRSPTARDY